MPDLLISHIENHINKNEPIILAGDFNYSSIDWQNYQSDDRKLESFAQFMLENGFTQLVDFPTRGKSLLDLIFTNDLFLVQNVNSGPQISKCDHGTILAEILHQKLAHKYVVIRDYDSVDYSYLNEVLQATEFSFLDPDNPLPLQDKWSQFHEGLSKCVSKNVPLRNFVLHKKPQFSNFVRKLRKKAYRLFKKYKTSQAEIDYQNYLVAARRAQNEKRFEMKNREQKILESKKDKKFWSYIKSKLSYKSEIPCILNEANEPIYDLFKMAERFNDYFCSVFTNDDGNMPIWNIPVIPNKLEIIDFTPTTVTAKLSGMAKKLSSGPDGIPAYFLKQMKESVSKPLSDLFNSSMQSSQLPTDWLTANIKPLFKKGKSNLVSNYRPISLTAVPCNIMQAIIADSIFSHVKDVIFPGQHGFQPSKSTVTQLLETFSEWTKSVDDGHCIDVLYIDIAKAFDSVSHPKLLNKLKLYGIDGKLLSWIEAFLYDRKQRVIIHGIESSEKPVTAGGPQGTALAPLLFLLYINDLPLSLKSSTVKLFADDCKIYFIIKSNQSCPDKLQEDIDILVRWASESQLKIAFEKCNILHIGKKNPRRKYKFGELDIPVAETIKDLGIWVSSNLKFHDHIRQIVKNAACTAMLIHRCFLNRNPAFMAQMFMVYVRPKLEYASQVWNPSYKIDINLLENVQRRYTKRIPGFFNLSYPDRLARLNLYSLELRRLHLDLIYTYKLLHGLQGIDYRTLYATFCYVQYTWP